MVRSHAASGRSSGRGVDVTPEIIEMLTDVPPKLHDERGEVVSLCLCLP